MTDIYLNGVLQDRLDISTNDAPPVEPPVTPPPVEPPATPPPVDPPSSGRVFYGGRLSMGTPRFQVVLPEFTIPAGDHTGKSLHDFSRKIRYRIRTPDSLKAVGRISIIAEGIPIVAEVRYAQGEHKGKLVGRYSENATSSWAWETMPDVERRDLLDLDADTEYLLDFQRADMPLGNEPSPRRVGGRFLCSLSILRQ